MKTRNLLRELIESEKPSIGTRLFTIWPGMAEVVGYSRAMDYIEFSGQYAPYDLFALENFGRAIDMFDDMSSLMKLDQEPRTFLAERAVGAGIQNLLFADIRSKEDAEHAVAAMKPDTPDLSGNVGIGPLRDMGYVYPDGLGQGDFVEKRNSGVVALMIEKKDAVDRLGEIFSVDGIDMVQFGASDYSMSIGFAGQRDHPKVKSIERHVIKTAIEVGIRPRAEINRWQDADEYIKLGVKDFCIGMDVLTVHNYCKEQGGSLRKTLENI